MSAEKIHPLEDLQGRLGREPELRSGLVLANGIFDLLHVGHIRYLEGAKRAGKRLLVALNSDASARRLKGAGRPIVPLDERMELVAALECVDWVTWFEEDGVERILRRLQPEAHAKGTDYTVETVPERGTARELGIRTIIVGDAKGHASTSLARRIRKAGADGA